MVDICSGDVIASDKQPTRGVLLLARRRPTPALGTESWCLVMRYAGVGDVGKLFAARKEGFRQRQGSALR